MSQNTNNPQDNKQRKDPMLVAPALGMGLSLIVDMYILVTIHPITDPAKYVVIGIGFLVFALFTVWFVNTLQKLIDEKSARQEAMYEELSKSTKATYLMMKKSFGEIEETLTKMQATMAVPVDDIIEAQKGIAKITITRNKENADALMNSNDKLLDRFFEYEAMLEKSSDNMLVKQKELLDAALNGVVTKQQELEGLVKNLEIELKREIASSGRTSVADENLGTSMISDEDLEKMIASKEVPVFEEEEEDLSADVISFEQSEEDIPVMEEEPTLGFNEEIPVLEEETPIIEEPVLEEIPEVEETLVVEEPLTLEEVPDIEESSVVEEAQVVEEEEIPAEDEPQEEKPPMPDLSDPNKVMSPEDIAALLANL